LRIIPALFALGAVLVGMAGPGAARPSQLFRTVEFRADSLAALPRWQDALARIEAERPTYEACAADATACPSRSAIAWEAMLRSQEGRPLREQITAVNRFVNQWPYRTDAENYGVSDYWAAPLEFLARSGDCEDYAIAKYVSLRRLGVEPERLRIVVLRDVLRDLPHAVLSVHLDGDVLILDNVTDAVLPHGRIAHYSPYYSVNEASRWVHVPPADTVVSSLEGGLAPAEGRRGSPRID
jgi:predicted transglutaminase-like cysteine proteinase